MKNNRAVDLLRLLMESAQGSSGNTGLQIVTVITSAPAPVTLRFAGSNTVVDPDIFEVPHDFLPLRRGERYFALPIVGEGSNRWGLIQEI